jgi:hypothetical protein
MFTWRELPKQLDQATRVETDTFRLYRTPKGDMYPSVTTVLGVREKPELEAWKKRVGEEEAARVSARATTRGTAIHDLSEKLLRNEDIPRNLYNPLYMMEWSPLKRQLELFVDNIMGCELMLYSDSLKMAGTADLIAEWKGKMSLIDFKTSTGWKHESQIQDYFVQTASYSVMAYERLGVMLPDIVILMVVDGGELLVFEKKAKDYYDEVLYVRNLFREKNGI